MTIIAIALVVIGLILAWHGPYDTGYVVDWVCWFGALSMIFVGVRILGGN